MDIKLAQIQDKEAILLYCNENGFYFPTTNTLYVVWENDKIVGLGGIEVVIKIEPFITNNPIIANKLYNLLMEKIQAKEIDKVECFVSNMRFKKVRELFEKLGFKFIEQTNRFIKILEIKNANN